MPSHLISLVEAPSMVLSCNPGGEAGEKRRRGRGRKTKGKIIGKERRSTVRERGKEKGDV